MFRAIGFVIVLYAIAQMMTEPFNAFQRAATETFDTVSVAAALSQKQLIEYSQ